MTTIYKACKNSIVILELSPDSITNEHREGVIDSNFAKFRTNKAKVISITDPLTNKKMNVDYSMRDPTFLYTVGELVEAIFDPVINRVCSSGVHYFKTYKGAFSWYYANNKKINGKYIGYNKNGRKMSEANYKDGKREGKQEEWYDNGQKMIEANYTDGEMEGKQEEWYDNGQKMIEANYKDGKNEGKREGWCYNGQKSYEHYYKDGMLELKQEGM